MTGYVQIRKRSFWDESMQYCEVSEGYPKVLRLCAVEVLGSRIRGSGTHHCAPNNFEAMLPDRMEPLYPLFVSRETVCITHAAKTRI